MSQQENNDRLIQTIQQQLQSQMAGTVKARKAAKRSVLTKAALMCVTGTLILGSLVYLGVAWYTRVTSTHAVTFEVADYELAINDNTDNEFLVNVYQYNNVQEKTMAPGTAGYIPLRMSARHSDIDVTFSIILKNRMPQELQSHIRFFYLVDKSTGDPVVCDVVRDEDQERSTLAPGEEWKFLSDPDNLDTTKLEKVYFPAYPESGVPDDLSLYTIEGTVDMTTEKMIYIYWEWYFDAEDAYQNNAITSKGTEAEWKTTCQQWDALDTDMGRYPLKYYESMYVHLTCVGVQSVPELEQRETKSTP